MLTERIHGILLLALAALALAASGCDEGGPQDPVLVCIDFTSASGAAGVTSVLSADSTCDVADVEITATNITDVFALDVEILYDPAIAAFSSALTVDSFLRSDGADLVVIISEPEAGRVVLGVSRTAATGVDIGADPQQIAVMRFLNTGMTGSGVVGLSDECLLGSETPPLPKVGLVCTGGTLRVE